MRNRNLLFQLMIWSLGIGAAFGVFAALTASYDTVGRVALTAFLTCGVATALWAVYRQFPQQVEVMRIAEVSFGAAFLFALLGIWNVGDSDSNWLSALALFFCGSLATVGWALRGRSGWDLGGTMITCASTMALVLFLASIWVASGRNEDRLLETGFGLLGWMIPGALCLVGKPSLRLRPIRALGVGAAGFGLFVTVLVTTDAIDPADWIGKLLFVTGSLTAVVLHANLCSMASLTERQQWLRFGAIGMTVLTAIFTDLCLLFEVSEGLLPRLAFASAIPAAFGTIAILLTAQYNKRTQRTPPRDATQEEAATASYETLVLECPACGTRQRVAVGASQCTHCGLGFEIRLTESKQVTGAA